VPSRPHTIALRSLTTAGSRAHVRISPGSPEGPVASLPAWWREGDLNPRAPSACGLLKTPRVRPTILRSFSETSHREFIRRPHDCGSRAHATRSILESKHKTAVTAGGSRSASHACLQMPQTVLCVIGCSRLSPGRSQVLGQAGGRHDLPTFYGDVATASEYEPDHPGPERTRAGPKDQATPIWEPCPGRIIG
jgi:hypothetical protein